MTTTAHGTRPGRLASAVQRQPVSSSSARPPSWRNGAVGCSVVLALSVPGFGGATVYGRWTSFGIFPATMSPHVSEVLRKLGARDRVQLVIAAYQSGLAT